MSLSAPTVGDITDRLTILSLNMLSDSTAVEWRQERTSLMAKLRAQTLNGAWFTALLDLATVNGALWHAEDMMREFRQEGTPTSDYGPWGPIVDCAFRIQALNDQRKALIAAIDKETRTV